MTNGTMSFGQQLPAQPTKKNIGPAMGQMNDQITNVTRRLKVLEERYNNLQRKTQVTDQNMLASHKRINTEIKTTLLEVQELRSDLRQVRETLVLAVKELKECARRADVEMLEKYLNLWQPVKFVTAAQVERIVQDELMDRKEANRPGV